MKRKKRFTANVVPSGPNPMKTMLIPGAVSSPSPLHYPLHIVTREKNGYDDDNDGNDDNDDDADSSRAPPTPTDLVYKRLIKRKNKPRESKEQPSDTKEKRKNAQKKEIVND